MRNRLLLLLVLTCLLASCQGGGGAPWEHRFTAMGTEFRLLIPRGETRDPSAVFDAVETLMHRLGTDLYPWADGELAALNAALARGTTFQASGELAGLLNLAQRLSRTTEGLFDPGVGALVELWGFNEPRPGTPGRPPADADVDALLDGCIGIANLRIRGSEISSACEGPLLDLGGIGKGYAVDRAMSTIRNAGVAHALLDAGGDVRAMGRNARRAWRVGVQHPREDAVLGSIELATGEALFTSGDYQRYFTHDGDRFGHILDPATGRPVRHTAAVTVLAGHGINADAAATAVYVAGPDRWREVAARLEVRAVLRVDADGSVEMTGAFGRRLEQAPGAPAVTTAGDG